MRINLTLFPLPHIIDGTKLHGSLIPWPDRCLTCITNQCISSQSLEVGLCSYGFNYKRISKEIVIGGFLLREFKTLSPARKKNLREYAHLTVSKSQIENVIQALSGNLIAAEEEILDAKKQILEEYVQQEQYKYDFLDSLQEKISQSLTFVHDYKQINAEIAQNINLILETKYKGRTLEGKLIKATPEERSIYKASKILEEKLNVAKLLVNPHLINRQEDFLRFRFHGLVQKYIGIYSSHIAAKSLDVEFSGQSYMEIVAHPLAVAVIPHTFIDNAIKYSPQNGTISIYIQDQPDYIDFSVSSFGPRVLPDEKDKIFQLYYRGQVATRQEEEGAGYGLYVSQLVAMTHLGQKITFTQDTKQKPHFGHLTTFMVKIPHTVLRLL